MPGTHHTTIRITREVKKELDFYRGEKCYNEFFLEVLEKYFKISVVTSTIKNDAIVDTQNENGTNTTN